MDVTVKHGFNPFTGRNPADFTGPAPSLASQLYRRVVGLAALRAAPAYPVVKFIDISHWVTIPDAAWPTMKAAGWELVAIKASEGTAFIDAKFEASWRKAVDNGLLVMPYHFFRCNLVGGDQADFFLNTIAPLMTATGGKILPPAGDFETTDSQSLSTRQARISAFLAAIESGLRTPACYSSPGLWFSVAGNMPMPYYGWVAHWTSADQPTLPTGWQLDKRLFWQKGIWNNYWWCESVPGCQPDLDVDVFFGDSAALQVLAGVQALTLEERVADLERRVDALERR